MNVVDEGALSNEVSCNPAAPGTAPAAPTLDSSTASDRRSSSNGRHPAVTAEVRSPGGLQRYSLEWEALVTTVGAGRAYRYWPHERSEVLLQGQRGERRGRGALSNELSAVPATVPGAPTLNTATAGNAR